MSCSSCKHGDHGAPPSSEIMPTHDDDMSSIGKTNQHTAGVSAHWFDATNNKKHIDSLKKHTFCLRAHWLGAYNIIVNKVTEPLVSGKKMHHCVAEIVCHCATSGECTHLLMKPLEASGLGGSRWWCFLCCMLLVVCCAREWWLAILGCHTAFPLVILTIFFTGEFNSQIFYVLRF